MVVRIHNVDKWAKLDPGNVLNLQGDHQRMVRVEFNCPAPTRVDVVGKDGSTFLAVIQGLEVVEFVADADTYLAPTSDDEVWYFTNDGVSMTHEDFSDSFTKIANRRARNPELERMMFKLEQNMNRRTAALQAEVAMLQSRQRDHDDETGEVIEDEANGDPALAGAEAETGDAPASGAVPPASGKASGATSGV